MLVLFLALFLVANKMPIYILTFVIGETNLVSHRVLSFEGHAVVGGEDVETTVQRHFVAVSVEVNLPRYNETIQTYCSRGAAFLAKGYNSRAS